MKKRFAYCVILCVLISLMANSTLAYFTTQETARNVITSGGIDIQTVEYQQTADGLKPYPAEPIEIMPGSKVSKIVSIKNLDEPAWIRMACTVTVKNEAGETMNVSEEELGRIMTFNADTANWTYKDGWWYYGKALAAGEEAKPLFTEVTFVGEEMDDTYQNCTMLLDVTAQAVQQVHNGATVMDAAGWPAT